MIGVGSAFGLAVGVMLLLTLFSILIIPVISVLGFNKTRYVLKFNGFKRILILIVFYLSVAIFGQLVLIKLLSFGFAHCIIWIGLLLLSAIGFNLLMDKHNRIKNK